MTAGELVTRSATLETLKVWSFHLLCFFAHLFNLRMPIQLFVQKAFQFCILFCNCIAQSNPSA